ncbi:MAG: hypothetical protein HN692_06005 [Candidatus Cloacimonetes bacterium]|nr:hypothetical protein [Candidatus Cloacimonadota bacterium]
MIYTHMTGGWGTADLRIKTSNDWDGYETDDAIIISHDLTTVRNDLVVGGDLTLSSPTSTFPCVVEGLYFFDATITTSYQEVPLVYSSTANKCYKNIHPKKLELRNSYVVIYFDEDTLNYTDVQIVLRLVKDSDDSEICFFTHADEFALVSGESYCHVLYWAGYAYNFDYINADTTYRVQISANKSIAKESTLRMFLRSNY